MHYMILMSEKMMSQKKLGEIKSVPYNKPQLKNLCNFLETSQLLYAAPNAIIDSIAVTHMEWRVG